MRQWVSRKAEQDIKDAREACGGPKASSYDIELWLMENRGYRQSPVLVAIGYHGSKTHRGAAVYRRLEGGEVVYVSVSTPCASKRWGRRSGSSVVRPVGEPGEFLWRDVTCERCWDSPTGRSFQRAEYERLELERSIEAEKKELEKRQARRAAADEAAKQISCYHIRRHKDGKIETIATRVRADEARLCRDMYQQDAKVAAERGVKECEGVWFELVWLGPKPPPLS